MAYLGETKKVIVTAIDSINTVVVFVSMVRFFESARSSPEKNNTQAQKWNSSSIVRSPTSQRYRTKYLKQVYIESNEKKYSNLRLDHGLLVMAYVI